MTEMERLCRELAPYVYAHRAGAWLEAHGMKATTLDEDPAAARADIERRIADAAEQDAARAMYARGDSWGALADALSDAAVDAVSGNVSPEFLRRLADRAECLGGAR